MLNQNKLQFIWKLQPMTWISLSLLLLMFPLGIFLPISWGWENGPLENVQLAILFGCMVVTWVAAYYHSNNRKVRNFWLWLTIFLVLLIGRELSWGRVLFYQISIGENGPMFISSQDLWFTPFVTLLIASSIIALLIGMWRNNPIKNLQQVKVPLPDIIILFLAVFMASLFEKKSVSAFFHHYGYIFEEFAEIIVYWSIFSITVINASLKKGK